MSADGRRAIVTGAGSGIGQEVALQLLAAGARVTGVDINDRGLDPVRTVDPPLWRGENDPTTMRKCQWSVWKSLEAIPEREYERIGRTKPPLPVIQPGIDRPSTGGAAQ